ncbi:MAG: AzlC family ABC transporter permease [Butyribacter sp.]|nr:AzlC family ABC transporter permease [bacterium]MDY3853369.1 AzlC family ABC transporter permease [Butyribacter sp.]
MREIKQGLKDGIPIALGYLSVSFTFGLMAVSAGMTWWQAVLISMVNLTSAGQFAGLEIMVTGGTLIEMALSQLVINLRYALMSLSLSQKVDKTLNTFYRFIVGAGVTDEIFAVAMSREKKVSRYYMFGLIAIPYLGWAGGTLAGAMLGNILPEIVRSSLGIAIYGMFLAIIIPKAKEDTSVLKVIIIAVILSCCFRWIPVLKQVSSGFVIIICAVTASLIGAIFYPLPEEDKENSCVEDREERR